MNTFTHRLGSLACGLLLGLIALPATADDTEIFIASQDPSITGAKPNILFIIDNSGSMDSTVTTQEAWNPSTTFSGCYNANRLYFSTNSSRPGCGSSNYIEKTANYCDASKNALASVGSYSDRMLAWRSSNRSWVALSGGSNRTRPMECRNDRGVHGQAAGDGEPYAATGIGGPWAAGTGTEPSWNNDYTIWDGNWLNWYSSGGTVTQTRMEIVRNVANNMLASLNGVNVGLMHFNVDQGGTVAHAIEPIGTARSSLQAAVSGLTASTWTPLSETLYEAGNYYMGRNVDYGNTGPVLSVGPSRTTGTVAGTTYKKPVLYACQKNYIVLLTDGLPTRDVSATAKIKALPQWAATVTTPACSGAAGSHGQCMSDLAEYLRKHDLDSSLTGTQTVTTYTIGFGVDLALGDTTFLQETANKGGGRYFPAGDTATLQAALTTIVYDILDDATTFSTPTAPVNAFNRTTNMSDVFVSVFAPSVSEHWTGNLKKYQLKNGRLVDVNDQPAVDADTGFFSKTSRSYWSDAVDGNSAQLGGAAGELPVYTARNLYTNIASNQLAASSNAVSTANVALTAAMIGAPAADRDTVINWARGLDSNDEDDDGDTSDIRHVMGDPLHVRPVNVLYGGTMASPDATVYVSTNDGYLHAIDPDDGSELWAFVPVEMLGRLYDLYLDEPTATRTYGLDGDISVFIANDDGDPGISGSERVILLFGMRRGGDTVYALDVTDRGNPQVLWRINSNTTGFSRLGQTWSPPVTAKVRVDATIRDVALFGGGYDDAEDATAYRSGDSRGNAIYMVDVLTGELLWRAGGGTGNDLNLSAMTHAIPAGLRVLDLNLDGLADRVYVGDMAGQVWRFDINNGQPAASLVDGGVFASLGGAAVTGPVPDSAARRFFATPDVARIVANNRAYLSINIGSGHRGHPLDTATDDQFFALRDYKVLDTIATASYPAPIQVTDLVDITGDLTPTIAYNSPGWRLRLDLSAGEKVMTESLTFDNVVLFTSFSPGGQGDACIAAGGLNRLYLVNARDGSPVTNLDGSLNPDGSPDTALTADDRYRELNQGGIAPDPAVFFSPPDGELSNGDPVACLGDNCDDNKQGNSDGSQPTLCIGVECFDPGFANPPRRTHWNQDGTE